MPLIGTANSGQYSPADIARRRALAEQLLAGQRPAVDPLSAIAQTLSGSLAGYENRQAAEQETAGRSAFNDSLAKMLTDPNVTIAQLAQTAGDPWANPAQSQLIAALMGKELERDDPMKALQRQIAEQQLKQSQLDYEQDLNPPAKPADLMSVSPGETVFDPNTRQPVYTGPSEAPKPSTPPAGYRYAANGQTMEYIPGGPADPSTAGRTTEATRRNQQLASVIVPELENLMSVNPDTGKSKFDALSQYWDQIKAAGGDAAMFLGQGPGPEYQEAQNALRTIIASYLYSVSGATANPGEVQNQMLILTPRINESAESIAAKKARVIAMVEAVKKAATGTPIDIGAADQESKPEGEGWEQVAPNVYIRPAD